MPTKLSEKAVKESSFIIVVEFYERTPSGGQNPIVPNAGLTWKLFDKNKNIINDRLHVPLVSAQVVEIVLFGDDLQVFPDHVVDRFVTVEGTYDSIYGTNLPLVDEVSFQIENVKGKPESDF